MRTSERTQILTGGLYIHIPFCHSKCAYCDFHSYPETSAIGRYVRSRYIEALIAELQLRQVELPQTISTIYIGGGTPSILSTTELHRIVSELKIDDVIEFTIEANPEDINSEWCKQIVDIGVNRVSMGVQSLDDTELNIVGRRHTSTRALAAIDTLYGNGIRNISADLIFGIPGQTVDSWRKSVDTLCQSPITHLSAYSLSYEPGTRLTAMVNAGRIKPVDEEIEIEMYETLNEVSYSHGFEHYEISNFARHGLKAIHNSGYWNFKPYLGLGPGAHSFDGQNTRRSNPGDSRLYIDSVLSGKTIYEEETELPTQQINDLIITALRTSDGLNLDDFSDRFGESIKNSLLNRARKFIDNSDLMILDNTIRIPEKRWMVSNAILREIIF